MRKTKSLPPNKELFQFNKIKLKDINKISASKRDKFKISAKTSNLSDSKIYFQQEGQTSVSQLSI